MLACRYPLRRHFFVSRVIFGLVVVALVSLNTTWAELKIDNHRCPPPISLIVPYFHLLLHAFNLREARKVSPLVLQMYCGNIFSSHSEAKPWKCVCADLQNHAAARAPGRFRIALRYKLRQKHANTTSYAQSLPRTCLPSLWCFGHRFTALSALGGFRGLIGILTLFMRAFFAKDMTPQLAQGPRPAAESRAQRDTKVRDPLLLPSDRYVLSP